MEHTRSKNYILTFFLSLAATLILGGCASAPLTTPAVGTDASTLAATTPMSLQGEVPPPPPSPATINSSAAGPTDADANQQVADDETKASATDTEAAQPAAEPNAKPENIWDRIRAGFRLPRTDDDLTRQHEQWFVDNAEFRRAMFERAKLYLYYIVDEVQKRKMPMEIALLPAIESAYKPYAYSRARAVGLWQFIPSTGRLYGLKRNWWYDGRRDIIASTRAALDYLQKLHDDFNGDWQLALAAYNAGEGRVQRAVEWNRRHHLPADYEHLRRLKRETRNYVPKLMAMVNIVSDPKRFGIQLPDIPNQPYFARVEADSQVDLGVIARLTGMEVDDLHFINPGYIRRATDPNGPHHILVPVDKKEAVVAGLSKIPDDQRVQWLHHRVRRGDTLYDIARHYRISVRAIKTANNLRGNLLHVGQNLMLPISTSIWRGHSAKPIPTAATGGRPIFHRVRRGETLSSIARHYGVLVHELAEWNFMRPNDILHLGRRLKIWIDGGPQAFRHDPTAIRYT